MPQQPSSADLYVSTLLSNVLVGWMQDQTKFAATRVFPNIPVDLPAGIVPQYKIDDLYRIAVALRAPGSEAVEMGFSTDNTKTFLCQERAVKHLIPDPIAASAQAPYQQDRDVTKIVGQQALLRRESDWMTTFFKTGVWGRDWVGQSSADTTHKQYWDSIGSTPVEDVIEECDYIESQTGYRPNKLTLGPTVRTALTLNPEILDRIKFGGSNRDPANVTDAALAELFGVDEVIRAAAVTNTAAEGATKSMAFLAGRSALLTYAPSEPSIWVPSAGYTFAWRSVFGAPGDLGFRTKKYRWEIREGDYIEVQGYYDMQTVAVSLGTFFSNISST